MSVRFDPKRRANSAKETRNKWKKPGFLSPKYDTIFIRNPYIYIYEIECPLRLLVISSIDLENVDGKF